jgi:dihydroorotase
LNKTSQIKSLATLFQVFNEKENILHFFRQYKHQIFGVNRSNFSEKLRKNTVTQLQKQTTKGKIVTEAQRSYQ